MREKEKIWREMKEKYKEERRKVVEEGILQLGLDLDNVNNVIYYLRRRPIQKGNWIPVLNSHLAVHLI